MNYGIPFIRPFTSPFGVPFLGVAGGGSPSVPVGALATYTAYSPSNFTLVTDNKVNVWQDETVNGNDLTQSTSGNQPTLVEDNTVTQFTASNQPTFAKDKQVSQDTLANMPTYDETAGALAFDGGSTSLKRFALPQGNFSIRIGLNVTSGDVRRVLTTEGNLGNSILQIQNDGAIRVVSSTTGANSSETISHDIPQEIIMTKEGVNLKISANGSVYSILESSDLDYSLISTIGTDTASQPFLGNINSFEIYNQAITDPTNITETPDFYLDASDPSTMINDSDAEPQDGDSVRLWHDPSAVDVMAFGVTNSLKSLMVQNLDFTYEFDVNLDSSSTTILASSDSVTSYFVVFNTGLIQAISEDVTNYQLGTTGTIPIGSRIKIKIVRSSNLMNTYVDGVQVGNIDVNVGTSEFLYQQLGINGGNTTIKNLYSFKQWNSADSSGAPDFTLTPDPTKLRTSANANPVLGEDVAKWYADEWSGYRDNHVLFDPVKYMEGLPTQAGDFTYIFKYQDDDQATAGAIVSSNIDSSGISNVDGDTTELIAGDATSYSFDNTGATSYRMVAYLKSGDDVYNVTDYVTTPTQDATGKAFNLTSLGKATGGKDMKVKEFYLYDRELVGTDLDYFFYERDVNTGEILLPPTIS